MIICTVNLLNATELTDTNNSGEKNIKNFIYMFKEKNFDDYEIEEQYSEEEDGYSEMSPERSPFESDEDYEDRMSGLYGEDWND